MSFRLADSPPQLVFTHEATYYQDEPLAEIEVAVTDQVGILLGESLITTVMVDSGADYTILDERWAPRLGLDLASLPDAEMTGIGGVKVPGRVRYNVLIGLCGIWVPSTVIFQTKPQPQLLGRDGVFESLNIAFQHGTRRLLGAVA